MALTLEQVDLTDLTRFRNGPPHEMFALLRRERPVFWHEDAKCGGFWALTRYRDIVPVNRDTTTFSSHRGGILLYEAWEKSVMLSHMDPPRHTQLRKLVSGAFTPRRINALEGQIRQRAEELVDKIAPTGECDFVRDVAMELPIQVICEMLNIPVEDRGKILEWGDILVGFDDPEYNHSELDQQVAAMSIISYASEHAERRRNDRGDDVLSALLEAEIDGERLTEMEFNLFFFLLTVAGNETTRAVISNSMLALLEHPGERARLAADPSLMRTAVEEFLRWSTPVMYFCRTATRDTEIAGQPIAEGDKVAMWYISANFDEEVFDAPYRFDVGRTPNEHVSFGGGGGHYCIGAALARLELRIFFETLLRRLPDMALAGPVERLQSNFANGIKRMPVQFSPA